MSFPRGTTKRDKGSEPFVRPFRPTVPGLADLTVQLALNLRLEGIVAQRRARLARRSNITRDIDVSNRGRPHPYQSLGHPFWKIQSSLTPLILPFCPAKVKPPPPTLEAQINQRFDRRD